VIVGLRRGGGQRRGLETLLSIENDRPRRHWVVKAREIGPVGTALRVVAGLGLLYLAGAVEGGSWDVSWFDPLVGFIALPCAMAALGLIARRYAGGPIHFTGVLGHAVNAVVIVLLLGGWCFSGGGFVRSV